MSNGRIENLKPWARGVSGNPHGRPRRDALTAALRDQLAEQIPGEPSGGTVAEGIAAALIKRALRGDVRAIREVAERTEGRAAQAITVRAEQTETVEQRRERVLLLIQTLAAKQPAPDTE